MRYPFNKALAVTCSLHHPRNQPGDKSLGYKNAPRERGFGRKGFQPGGIAQGVLT